MEQITKPHCGARLDRLPDCRWHSSMFAIVAFGLLVCWWWLDPRAAESVGLDR